MKLKPFNVGSTVFSVRDMEMSDGGIVTDYQDDGKVLVKFADGILRALPVASLVRAADRKAEPRFASENLAKATCLGDYIARVESGILTKEKSNEKTTR